jgi:hypothetical protein
MGENAYGVVRNDHEDHNTEGVPTDAQEFARNTATRPGGGPDGKPPQRLVPDPPKPSKYSETITTTIISDVKLGVVKETEKSVWRCRPVAFVPIPHSNIRSVVAPIQLNKLTGHPRSWEETFHDKGPQRWKKTTTNQQDIDLMRETMSVWPSLVEGDGRFLPNPKETSGNYSMVPPETKRDAEPPIRNAADRDYGGEETTGPSAQPQRVKHHGLDLTAEPSVLAKGYFTTPTTSRGGLTTRPNQLTIRKMWCCTEPGAQWQPIQTFPRCTTWSAVTEALPERCDVGAVLRNFWLLTRGCERKQQTATSQIINSHETILKMNRHVSSENNCEAWMATWKRDMAELQRLNVLINLRSKHELRHATEQSHLPRTPTVPPPGPHNEERRRTGSADAPDDVDIVEHIQGTTESAESWFTESARRAIAHGRRYKLSGHDTATKTPTPRDPDLDVITLEIRRSPVPQHPGNPEPTPQDRVLDYRRKMESYWSGALFPGKQRSIITQEPDNNDNMIVHQTQQTPVRHCAESMSSEP